MRTVSSAVVTYEDEGRITCVRKRADERTEDKPMGKASHLEVASIGIGRACIMKLHNDER